MVSKISVLGCGWLGLPLSKHLIENGFKINGSTTSNTKTEELKDENINPFLIKLTEEKIHGDLIRFLAESDTLIINVPPGLRQNPDKNHVLEMMHLITAIEASSVKNIIYVSSTSVFEDRFDFPIILDSTDPNSTTNTSKQLIAIEENFKKNEKFNCTIIRFGGLFGSDRHPAYHLSGKKNISNPEAPINLIHRKDCIEILHSIIKLSLWNVTLNAVFPYHPSKKEYYTAYCLQENSAVPKFDNSTKSKGKIIDSSKLVQLLNYTFKVKP